MQLLPVPRRWDIQANPNPLRVFVTLILYFQIFLKPEQYLKTILLSYNTISAYYNILATDTIPSREHIPDEALDELDWFGNYIFESP